MTSHTHQEMTTEQEPGVEELERWAKRLFSAKCIDDSPYYAKEVRAVAAAYLKSRLSPPSPPSAAGTRTDGLVEAAEWHDCQAETFRQLAELTEFGSHDQLSRMDAAMIHEQSAEKIRALTPKAASSQAPGVTQEGQLILQRDAYEKNWAAAVSSREHMKQWYAERIERLTALAKERGFWPEMAAILANGTASVYEPPTYAQQLNSAIHRAEDAETRLMKANREISRLSSASPAPVVKGEDK